MPISQKAQPAKVQLIEFDYEPLIREKADACYHRLPQVGQYNLLNCFETYNQCELLVEKIVEEPVKPKSKSFFSRWWGSSKSKTKQEKLLEYKNCYLSFNEGYCVILEYTKVLPFRDFGVINVNSKTLMPAQEFDCKVIFCRSMFDLDMVATLNLIETKQKPEEERNKEQIMIELVFSNFALDDGFLKDADLGKEGE